MKIKIMQASPDSNDTVPFGKKALEDDDFDKFLGTIDRIMISSFGKKAF